MLHYTQRTGYSLIELLVVVAIIGILLGAGIASYNRFNEKQRVEHAALGFATELRVTQKRADAGERHALCTNDLDAYGVFIDTALSKIKAEIKPMCKPTSKVSKIFNLQHRSEFADKMEVFFMTVGLVPYWQTTGYWASDPANAVTIHDVQNRYRYEVSVSRSGGITIKQV